MDRVSAGPEQTEPATPTPPTPPARPAPSAVTTSMAAFGGNQSCPNCGARMAADQRYCLNCGHRRGEPRLPFMDAVTFMESMNGPAGGGATPPPPPSAQKSSPRMNANAALIAGVATLVLAIGVGFLIGRSGHENTQQAAATPQVIKVEGNSAGGGETAEAAAPEERAASPGAKKNAKSAKGGKASSKPAKSVKPSEVKEGSTEEKEIAKEKTNEVLHTEEGVEIETGAQVGGKCKTGAAGCSESGEFTGEFFGE
jgi:hypothetical protein